MWQQLAEPIPTRFAFQVSEDHLQVAAELPEQLPAGAARGRRRHGCSGDSDVRKVSAALGKSLKQGDALGADGQAVGRVLDVAAGDYLAVGRPQGGADLEVRV